MNIGRKIRTLRIGRGMTQRELAGDEITRNMLSSIENGAAMPSISTLLYIADRLDVSPAYFFDDSEKPQTEIESTLCSLYNEGEYEKCISAGSALPAADSGNILAQCYLNLAVSDLFAMRNKSARENLLMAKEYCEQSTDITDTVYNIVLCLLRMEGVSFDTGIDELSSATLPSYHAMTANFYMFLLANASSCRDAAELQNNSLYGLHVSAKAEISAGRFESAKEILRLAEKKLDASTSPALMYAILDDLEACCLKTDDYKGAYEVSHKKQEMTDRARGI